MKRQVKKKSPNSGSVRIVSGQWRGRKLPVLDAQGLRPTTDRTKETLFNWLAPYLTNARCLDAFSGSGSLGIEALSRRARHCLFNEMDKGACAQLTDNLHTLKADMQSYQVRCGDFLSCPLIKHSVDVVFLDPPFGKNLVAPSIAHLQATHALADEALIYIETERDVPAYQVPDNWQLLKHKHTSQISYSLYQVCD